MMEADIQGMVESLMEIEGDSTVPKNLKKKLAETAKILKNHDENLMIRISKAISELEETVEDQNIQPYTRNQILGILSMLEMVQ